MSVEEAMMTEDRQQKTVRLEPQHFAWLDERAKAEGRSFNDMLRIVLEQVLHPATTTRTTMVEVWLHGEDDARVYRRATVEYDWSTRRLDVMRGERCIASFDADDLKHWDTGEADSG